MTPTPAPARRRARPPIGLVCLLAALLLAPLACKKPPFIETVEQTPYLGLPQGLDHVTSLNVKRLRDRDFYTQLRRALNAHIGLPPGADNIRQHLGIDPLKDIDTLILGAKGSFNKAENPLADTVFIARGQFVSPAMKLETFRRVLAEEYLIAPPPFKATKHPGAEFDRFALEAPSQYNENIVYKLNFGFPNENLMVFSFSPSLLGETLDVIAAQADGIRKDEFWLAMLQRPNIGAILWGTGNANLRGSAAGIAPPMAMSGVQEYFYNIDFSPRLDSTLGLVCTSIDAAERLSGDTKQGLKTMEQQMAVMSVFLPETAKIPGKTSVLPKGQTVEIGLSLSEADTSALQLEWRRFGQQAESGQFPFMPGAAGQ
jgi:hypothetical protein